MYTYCKKYGNRILLRDHGGDVKIVTKHDWNIYVEDKNGSYKTIFGKLLRKETFDTIKKATDVIKENFTITLYGSKNFGYQYIRDEFLRSAPITPKDLYIANIDIETGRDENGYSSAAEVRCPITAVTHHDMIKDTYIVWGYKEEGYTPKSDNVSYVNCRSERDLLIKIVNFYAYRSPDIITGWNIEMYDIPYIINRIHKLFKDSDNIITKLSPFGYVNEKETHDGFGNTHQIYDIVGISALDYLTLFKKFTYNTPENYKLDTIAHLILGDTKIDYSEYANLQELYDKNYEKFIDYNIKDTTIVARLDNKLKLFDLILSVAYKAGINYGDVLSPVTTWDVLIYNAVMDQGMVPIYDMPDVEGGNYIGAFVKEPIPGMYIWVVSCDLNSLYPHLQMGVNISPEKRIPDSKLPKDLLNIREALNTAENGIQELLKENIDTSALLKYNVSLTPNGQFYKRDADGFIPVILEGLYNERKSVKKSMLHDKQKMEDDSNIDLSDQISAKNTLQMALKILMNSEYGALANKYFRYFDLRNAEAVTSSGQLAILWVAKHLNIFLNRILKTDDKDYVIAIDTDSVYLNLEYLVDVFIKTDDKKKIVDILDGWASKVLEPEINHIYANLASYINAHKQKMVMAREVIADKGIWTGKKRYALNVYDNEGVRYKKPKTKIMGLECVRSSVPEFSRTHIKNGIIKILTEDEENVQNFIVRIKEQFDKQPPEEISFPRGTNNIEKWIDENGLPKKGCPIHVRGCIVYNNYLKKHGFIDETIKSGDKIKFCHLKQPNAFHSYVVSYPPAMNEEAYKELKTSINYEMQWVGTFFKPVNSIMECIGWNAEKVNNVLDICGGDPY